MANTLYATGNALAVKLWARKLWVEVLQETIAAKFIGKTPSSLIQMKDETTKAPGDRITIGLRMQLTAAGVQGDNTLQDNEEALTTYTLNVYIDQLRHAVRSGGKMSEQRVTFDVREEAKSGLVDWWSDRIDTSLFNQLCGYTVQSDTRYTGNQAVIAPDTAHRIWKGATKTDEGQGSSDTFTLDLIDKAVENARTSTPGIRPVKVMGGEYYVIFLHPNQVTDLRTNTNTGQWLDIQKASATGGLVEKNPIFTGALGQYNNTIIHVDKRVTAGVNSSTGLTVSNTRRAVFCGAQSAVIAFGRDYGSIDRFKWVEQLFDYENQLGVSAGLVYGAVKSTFNSADFATVTVSTYAAAHT